MGEHAGFGGGVTLNARFCGEAAWCRTRFEAEPREHPSRCYNGLVGSVIWRARAAAEEAPAASAQARGEWFLRIDCAHIRPGQVTFKVQLQQQPGASWEQLEAVQEGECVWRLHTMSGTDRCQIEGDLWPLAEHVDLPTQVLKHFSERGSGLHASGWPEEVVKELETRQVSGEARVFYCARAFVAHAAYSAFPEAALLTFGAWKLGLDEDVFSAVERLPRTVSDILASADSEQKTMHGNVYVHKTPEDIPFFCGDFKDLRRSVDEVDGKQFPCYLHEFSASALLGRPDVELNIISRLLQRCAHLSPHHEEITKGFFADAGVSFPGHCDLISWNQSCVQMLGSKILLSDVRWEKTKAMASRFGDRGYKDGVSIPVEHLSAEQSAMLHEFGSRVLLLPGDVGVFNTSQFHASTNPSRGFALFVGFLTWPGVRRFARDPRSLWACGDNPSPGEALASGVLRSKLRAARDAFAQSGWREVMRCSDDDGARWAEICEQAEAEICAGEERLYFTSSEVPVIPLELGLFGSEVVRSPNVLASSLAPACFGLQSLEQRLDSYQLRLNNKAVAELLQLADQKLTAGYLFDHAYAHLELANDLHDHLVGQPCGPALWSQACCLSEAVSLQLARVRTTSLADLEGLAAVFPELRPFEPCARRCAEARLDAAVALLRRSLRAPQSLGDWPPPLRDMLEADNLDALRKFRNLEALLRRYSPDASTGCCRKRRRKK